MTPLVNTASIPDHRLLVRSPSTRTARQVLLVAAVIIVLSIYANLSFVVPPAGYRFFPPFAANVSRNQNRHLGGEYFNIARALVAGRGYADPFHDPTGPTAWMPPVLPSILAALLWASDGDRGVVTCVVVVFQDLTLIITGLLVLRLATLSSGRASVACTIFLAALVYQFQLCFQFTHDCWVVLLMLDALLTGLLLSRPLSSFGYALAWGLFGGLCALAAPVTGFVWATVTLARGRRCHRARLAIAGLAAALIVSPWILRNYVVFARFIPIKSNLSFELYQSQCLQPTGLLSASSFHKHPYARSNDENLEYEDSGEVAYMDHKRQQFLLAIRTEPWDFLRRIGERALAATVVYVPFDVAADGRWPAILWVSRIVHPLPFLASFFLLATGIRQPLHPPERTIIAVYILYLLPYILVSYYERYALPLIGVDALLIAMAGSRFRTMAGPYLARLFACGARCQHVAPIL